MKCLNCGTETDARFCPNCGCEVKSTSPKQKTAQPQMVSYVENEKKKPTGTASLVLGIVGLVLSCIKIGGLLGIIGLILGIICLSKGTPKKGKAVTGIVLSVVAILVTGAMAMSGGASNSDKNTSHTNEAIGSSETKKDDVTSNLKDEPKVEYTTVSVEQMMNDLKSNAMKAQETYKNQYCEITGKLSTIDSSGKYISLHNANDDWAIVGVQCYIKDDNQRNQVSNMSRGDIVTLRGKITDVGEVMGYSLDIDSIDGYDITSSTSQASGAVEVDASTLVNDLNENALKAQNTYKGQNLIIKGKLSNIDSNGKYIDIKPLDDDWSFTTIQCYIKTDNVKKTVMDLSVGDTIIVNGKCTDVGEVLGYSIDIESVNK